MDAAFVVLVATLLAIPSFRRPLDSMDESVLLVYADQVRAGLVPHRDFFMVYGPGPFYLLAGLFSAFGSSLAVERVFGLGIHVAVALGCYAVGRSRDRGTALVAAVLALTLLFPLGTVAYAWLGAMACVVGALGAIGRHGSLGAPRWSDAFGHTGRLGRSRDLLAGALVGLCAAFRPEVTPIAALALVPHLWRTKRWIPVLFGAALGVTPMVLFAAIAGERMWRNIIFGRIGVNGSMRLADAPVRSAAILLSVLCVTGLLVWFAWRQRTRASVAYAIVAVGVLPQTLQRTDPEHALYTLCVTVPLLVVAVTPAVPTEASLRRRRLLMVAMCVALLGGLGATLLRAPNTVVVAVADRSVLLEPDDADAFATTRRVLLDHAPAAGTLFVGSTDLSRTSLSRITAYFLLPELRPSGYYLELAVGVSEKAGSGLVDDVRGADVLLLSPMPDGLMERLYPYLPRGSDEANEVVRQDFCAVAETPWGIVYEHHPCSS